MRSHKLWLATPPRRAALEVWLLGLLLVLVFSAVMGRVAGILFNTAVLLLCGVCGLWAVLRTELPHGSPARQVRWELRMAALVSIAMLSLRLPGQLSGLENIWRATAWGSIGISILLLGTGPGYLVARAAVRLWLRWDHMRRRRLLWSLTHAHLILVALACITGVTAFLIVSPHSRVAGAQADTAGIFGWLFTRVMVFIFPASGAVLVVTLYALALVLPPSALFSFIFTRQTTRRLEALATATGAMRRGHYGARVRVEGEDEVAQVQSDFNAMAGELERTLEDLQNQRDTVARLLESRQALIATVSHELRTPVATVRATLESMLSRPGQAPELLMHDLEVIDGEMSRLQALIDDLFTLARAETGGLALQRQPLDLVPAIRRMVEALRPLAWNSGRVEVVAEMPPALPPVYVDESRFEQILANLVRNGIRHTGPGGIVAVRAAAGAGRVTLEVCDTGEGIGNDELPHIWNRFYQGRNARSEAAHGGDGQGAGLGLALVKELTEAMDGQAGVTSVPGQGSCFTLSFPQA